MQLSSDANCTVKWSSFCFAVRWRCVCCRIAWFPKRPSPSFLSESLWSSFCFAVRWRCVCCRLAWFPKRPSPSFLSESLWLSVERAFKFKGLYFDFVYISSELFLFLDLRQRLAGQITYALVVPPRDNQLRHLAVIPLRLCLVRQRPD